MMNNERWGKIFDEIGLFDGINWDEFMNGTPKKPKLKSARTIHLPFGWKLVRPER